MPTLTSPFSVPKLGPVSDLKVAVPPGAEVVSIEMLVPPLAGLTVAAAKAELGAKNPPATSAMAAIKTDVPLRKRRKLSLKRERERRGFDCFILVIHSDFIASPMIRQRLVNYLLAGLLSSSL